MIERVGFDLLPAEGAFLELQLEAFLYGTLGRSLEKTILADVVTAWEEYDWLMFWRDHKLEANTAYIRLYLISHFFTQLLCLLIAIFPKWITDLLDEISGVIFHPLLNIHFLPDFFSFSLLVPAPPFFFMLPDFLIIHQYKLLIDSNNDESSQSKQSLIVSQYFSDGRA